MRKNTFVLACLLLGAQSRAAEAPVHLVPAIHAALKGVSGPMSRVARKLDASLDRHAAQADAQRYQAAAVERILKPAAAKGLPALPEILATHSARADRGADALIEAYLKAFEERRSREASIAGAENFMAENHAYLSSGRELVMKALLRDSPRQAAARYGRLKSVIERARLVAEALAGTKNAPPPTDPGTLLPQDRHTMVETARLLARFVLSDEMSAAGRDDSLKKMAEELELAAEGAGLHGDNPAVHKALYKDAAGLVREYLKAIAHEDDENGYFLRERALNFQRILVKFL